VKKANGPDPEGPLGPTKRGGAVPGCLIDSYGWWWCGEGYNNIVEKNIETLVETWFFMMSHRHVTQHVFM